ncbi:hypothetical protein BDV19DRAFT_233232 [Aspergillus venezuelensis]
MRACRRVSRALCSWAGLPVWAFDVSTEYFCISPRPAVASTRQKITLSFWSSLQRRRVRTSVTTAHQDLCVSSDELRLNCALATTAYTFAYWSQKLHTIKAKEARIERSTTAQGTIKATALIAPSSTG